MLSGENILQGTAWSKVRNPAWVDIKRSDQDRTVAVQNVCYSQELKRLKQYLSNVTSTCSKNVHDTIFEGLSFANLVPWSVARTEEHLKQTRSKLRKGREVPLRSIPGSNRIDMSR